MIPFGYVKMAGFIDESMDTNIQYQPDEFMSKSPLSKIFILSAGNNECPNSLLLFSAISYTQGSTFHLKNQLLIIDSGMPAEQAGFKVGDKIIRINNNHIDTWSI